MYILGLSSDITNPAACIIRDGQLVALIEEERLTRIKCSHGMFPALAIKACMQLAGITSLDAIDAIAWGWDASKYPLRMLGFFASSYVSHFPKLLSPFRAGPTQGKSGFATVLHSLNTERPANRLRYIRTQLEHAGIMGRLPPIHFIDHHESHAASAYYVSGLSEAAVLVVDGSGEETCTSIWHGRGQELRCIERIPIPDSLGWYYAAFTELLGFMPYCDEGKLMGLAAYGKPNPRYMQAVEKVLQLRADGTYHVHPRYTLMGHHHYGRHYADELVKLTGIRRTPEEPLTDAHRDLAFAVQQRLEEAMIALAKRAISATGNTALCIAGGVGLNCKANGAILQQAGCCCVFVQPAANDAGTALGAALVLAARMGTLAPTPLQHTHFGPAFSQDDIQNTLEHACLDYQTPHDIAQATADLVARDQVVGWFQGHMEFGSRALGGRSILANPANPNINAIVNGRVKFREAWRPFCPSMTAGTENNWLAHAQPAPFMTTAFAAQAGWQDTLPSVVHVDGTVRPQTVSPDRLPPERPESRFYDVIEHLGTHIGHPVVLNTSLNVRGEPIVCRPSEAIACFLSTDMDALAIGDFLLTKRA